MFDSFFRTHQYLVEHIDAPIRRVLMDEINWRDRLIGILGSRGVGKTTFLLQYIKESFGSRDKRCLYINMNNFYFQGKSLFEFATEFAKIGGTILVIDQLFKDPDWSKDLRMIYDRCPRIKVVFAGSSVMQLGSENPDLNGICASYNLRGFSFREFLNLQTGLNLRPYAIREIQNRHERISDEVLPLVNPMDYFPAYLHHGYYPFFYEKCNFMESLLKTINMMIEVDIPMVKEIELKYLNKIKKLMYLLATSGSGAPNVSQLAQDMLTSRATVMSYIKCLSDSRLVSMVYRNSEEYPKKPARLLMHNTNLMYAMTPTNIDHQTLLETFFHNAISGQYDIYTGDRSSTFLVDSNQRFRICMEEPKRRSTDVIYARSGILKGHELEIPIWMYGFLY